MPEPSGYHRKDFEKTLDESFNVGFALAIVQMIVLCRCRAFPNRKT